MARLSCGKISTVNPKIHGASFSRCGFLPNAMTGHVKWRNIEDKNHSLPGEVRDPIGSEWFPAETGQPRSDAEPLGMLFAAAIADAENVVSVVGSWQPEVGLHAAKAGEECSSDPVSSCRSPSGFRIPHRLPPNTPLRQFRAWLRARHDGHPPVSGRLHLQPRYSTAFGCFESGGVFARCLQALP